jgi:hypothetical protein
MLNFETELSRADGLYKSIVVKEHKYDLVELTITQKLTDTNTGKVISDTGYTTFYSNKEFKEFFEPLINELKVRFDNDNNRTNP